MTGKTTVLGKFKRNPDDFLDVRAEPAEAVKRSPPPDPANVPAVKTKRIVIDVPEDFHHEVKTFALGQKMTVKQFAILALKIGMDGRER